jgi:hypothetical protein
VIPLINIARHNKFVIAGIKAYKSPWCTSIRVNPLCYEILVVGQPTKDYAGENQPHNSFVCGLKNQTADSTPPTGGDHAGV